MFRSIRSVPGPIIAAFVLQASGALGAFASQIVLARWLGLSGYGTYAYAIAWITLLTVPVGIGLSGGAVRFIPEYAARGQLNLAAAFLRFSVRCTVRAGLIFAAGAGTAALIGGATGVGQSALVLAVAVTVPLACLSQLEAETARASRAVVRAYLPTLVVRPAMVVVSGYAVHRFAGLSAGGALGLTALAYAAVTAVQRRLRVRLSAEPAAPSRETREEWLRVSLQLALISGFVLLLAQTDIILVGSLLSARSAGLYAAASKTAGFVGLVAISVNASAAPRFAALHGTSRRSDLEAAAHSAARWTFFPASALAIGIIALSTPLLGVFGNGYISASWPLRVLVAGQVINAAAGSVGYLLTSTGHQRDAARIYAVCALLNIGAVACGVELGGVLGASVATALSMGVWNVWLRTVVIRRLRIRPSVIDAALASHVAEVARA